MGEKTWQSSPLQELKLQRESDEPTEYITYQKYVI